LAETPEPRDIFVAVDGSVAITLINSFTDNSTFPAVLLHLSRITTAPELV